MRPYESLGHVVGLTPRQNMITVSPWRKRRLLSATRALRPQSAPMSAVEDVAEVVYRSALEAINATKLQIKILDAQVEREWGRASSN